MLHFLAIIVMIVGFAGSFLTYIGKLNVVSLPVWGVITVVGVLATVFTRRPAN